MPFFPSRRAFLSGAALTMLARESAADAEGGTPGDAASFRQAGTGATVRSVQSKLSDLLSVKDFGAVGDGVTDDSVAIAAAIRHATTPAGLGPRRFCRGLHFPTGIYLVTRNNWIGENLGVVGQYGGRLDTILTGDGRHSSVVLFRPSAAAGGQSACYDQTQTPTAILNGFKVQNLGFAFDASGNGGNPVHFVVSQAAPGLASQNFRLNDTRFDGVAGSILFKLLGSVNEDVVSAYDTLLDGFAGAVHSPSNFEALMHHFYSLDALNVTGNLFEYHKGGCLKVEGLNAIMSGTAGVDTAILKLTGGANGQSYVLNDVRTELRGANTRVLLIPAAAENTIVFNGLVIANVANGQAWAKMVAQHHATIIFNRCILPRRTGVGEAGTLQLVDVYWGMDYATTAGAHSNIRFIGCDNEGARLDDVDGWVDYGRLTARNLNHATFMVTYQGCGNLPDSVEYGHPYRLGRSFNPDSPPKLVFRGVVFPHGDGARAVASADDLNIVVPRYNFVSEIVVMRAAVTGPATDYQIEFIDTAERNRPGSGRVFGQTSRRPNNAAITERVPILRQFSGPRAERTIWCRMKAGFTLTVGQTGDVRIGTVYAEVQ